MESLFACLAMALQNIGFFHEAVNLSKVWNLPVLWVTENNKYGMGTTVERASAVSEIRQKAEGPGR